MGFSCRAMELDFLCISFVESMVVYKALFTPEDETV